jgi:predicted NAD/FAD-binding protein
MSRIAIIGAGISGMAAGYLLSRKHEVSLFEREPRLGGHTHTHQIETTADVKPIDTGFIVHNDRTYPNLVRLFGELGVERQTSDMSFGVSCQQTGFEYSSRGLRGLFAGSGSWRRLTSYRLIREIVRFNRVSAEFLRTSAAAEPTLGDYLSAGGLSGDLARLYLLPMAAAVWSTSLEDMENFPAVTLLRFFDNHGFITLNGHPQWYVVKNGSSQYIAPLTAPYRERIVTDAQIKSVTRNEGKPGLHLVDGIHHSFDEVVFACHGPQALAMLGDATAKEISVLEGFQTSRNETVLHTDSRLLPRQERARASWNYHLGTRGKSATLTYHMNRLQGISTPEDYCVTLNASSALDRSVSST